VSCEIILVLHAPTNWNLEGRCQGHVDTPLCEQGREAAIALAQRLSNERIDAIYSSDLRRARETAQELARLKGLHLRTDARLREGRWAYQEVTDEFPTLPFDVDVEGRDDVRARVIEVMTEIARNHEGGRVVVVSHAGPVKQFIAHVRQLAEDSFPEFRAVRAAINRITYRDGVWSCEVLDDADHLAASTPSYRRFLETEATAEN
jgi:probable phosphoglycerate mutase